MVNQTKQALEASLKHLLLQKPLDKITISDLTKDCGISRMAFYYHFKDKYDLVNWIYYTECVAVLKEKGYNTGWELLEDLCAYFYNNRSFYRKTLSVDGQNSFSEYFRDIVDTSDMEKIFGRDDALAFYVNFYADAFLCAIKRWLLDKDCMPAKEFTQLLKNCLLRTSDTILQKLSDEPEEKIKKASSKGKELSR